MSLRLKLNPVLIFESARGGEWHRNSPQKLCYQAVVLTCASWTGQNKKSNLLSNVLLTSHKDVFYRAEDSLKTINTDFLRKLDERFEMNHLSE